MLIGFLQAFGQSVSSFPLHPYWGNNRTFISDNAALPVPAIVPFSTDPSSGNYKLFNEVYLKRKSLTEEEMRIAAWWADDPTQTASPPGHSYNLATIAVTSAEADIIYGSRSICKGRDGSGRCFHLLLESQIHLPFRATVPIY